MDLILLGAAVVIIMLVYWFYIDASERAEMYKESSDSWRDEAFKQISKTRQLEVLCSFQELQLEANIETISDLANMVPKKKEVKKAVKKVAKKK